MYRGRKFGPSPGGHARTVVDDALRLRACAFTAELGSFAKAAARLGVAVSSIQAACERGNMKAETAKRIREALDREAPIVKAAS